MSLSPHFGELIRELMEGLGPVSLRRMFGGAGVFADGLMFALVSADTLYFKTDAAGSAAFLAEGLEPFSYTTKTGRHTLTSYWRAPERCLEDPDAMKAWARNAMAVARAAATAKPAKAARRKIS